MEINGGGGVEGSKGGLWIPHICILLRHMSMFLLRQAVFSHLLAHLRQGNDCVAFEFLLGLCRGHWRGCCFTLPNSVTRNRNKNSVTSPEG